MKKSKVKVIYFGRYFLYFGRDLKEWEIFIVEKRESVSCVFIGGYWLWEFVSY